MYKFEFVYKKNALKLKRLLFLWAKSVCLKRNTNSIYSPYVNEKNIS